MTANHFEVANCTASKVIFEVCTAICSALGLSYLHLLRDQEERKMKVAEFEAKFGMFQAFGVIDGTHIPIMSPSINSQDYQNYKPFHSFNIQGVCDYRGLFLDVECRWLGSVHDAKMFATFRINRKLQNYHWLKACKCILSGMTPVPNYIIGDQAYPLTPFSMKELDTFQIERVRYVLDMKELMRIANAEVVFSNSLCSARNPVECAIGRLKARWSILPKN